MKPDWGFGGGLGTRTQKLDFSEFLAALHLVEVQVWSAVLAFALS